MAEGDYVAENWGAGANNVAPAHRVPAGAVRRLVNLDASPSGALDLRTGYEKVLDATDMRGAFGVRDVVVVVDGAQVRGFSAATGVAHDLGTIGPAGPIAGAVLNDELFMSTVQGNYRTTGTDLVAWGVKPPAFYVEPVAGGSLPAGMYKVAATAVGDLGEESGAHTTHIQLDGTQNLRVLSDDGRPLRVYASVANGATPFYQGVMLDVQAFSVIDDSAEYLTTDGLIEPPVFDHLTSHRGLLVGAVGNVLAYTSPLSPHLFDPKRNFVMYPKPITVVADTPGGVFVVSDRAYFLPNVASPDAQQLVVHNAEAVAGTGGNLPDGSATWFTRYGQVVGLSDGTVKLLNEGSYAPDVTAKGSSGVVEVDGKRLIITSMQGEPKRNNVATGDFAELEIG